MAYKSIEEIFEAFTALKILIIGDVMLDTYIHGTATRISPEAPVPVVNVQRRENRLGGAGNVALNIRSLGATPILCAVTGNDPEAETFIDLLHEQGINSSGIIRSNQRITTVKNRILSASQHLLRVDAEIDTPLGPEDKKVLEEKITDLIEGADLVIFEDYDKGCLDAGLIGAIIKQANQKGIPTVVDPKKRNFFHYQGCTLFKPNLKELREGLSRDIDALNQGQLENAIGQLYSKLGFKNAIVTLSEKGMYYQNDQTAGLLDAHVRTISDVSGAGDTVISIAGLCVALGMPLRFIAELSNLGGGIVCEYQGVLPVEKERLKKEAANNRILVGQLG